MNEILLQQKDPTLYARLDCAIEDILPFVSESVQVLDFGLFSEALHERNENLISAKGGQAVTVLQDAEKLSKILSAVFTITPAELVDRLCDSFPYGLGVDYTGEVQDVIALLDKFATREYVKDGNISVSASKWAEVFDTLAFFCEGVVALIEDGWDDRASKIVSQCT